jgi:hypothetical protein
MIFETVIFESIRCFLTQERKEAILLSLILPNNFLSKDQRQIYKMDFLKPIFLPFKIFYSVIKKVLILVRIEVKPIHRHILL